LRLATERDILERFAQDLHRRGVVGEDRAAKLVFLAAITPRVMERPVSLILKGPSSGGKNYTTQSTLAFFPDHAYRALSGMSERALIYDPEPLAHKTLVLYEQAGLTEGFVTYVVRSLLSEQRINYQTVEKTSDGLAGRSIVREGPTNLITTTTKIEVDAETETRLISVPIDDTAPQTEAILRAQAAAAQLGKLPQVGLEPWHALQRWLECAEHRVAIPFAPYLVPQPTAAVRLRRDFPTLLALIQTHAILHQATRNRTKDGAIIAGVRDYAVVRQLIGDLLAQGVEASVAPTVRKTVMAVRELMDSDVAEPTVTDVAKKLNLSKSAAWRRIQSAIGAGFLKNLEDKPGRPARLARGEPLPEDQELLPTPERVARLHIKYRGKTPLPGNRHHRGARRRQRLSGNRKGQ
jgi:hypothetical protein